MWEVYRGEFERVSYKQEPHTFKSQRFWSKGMCVKCGLLYLNNALTKWCISKGCLYSWHPQFRDTIRRLT